MAMKNLIVGQSGGPTAVINSSLYGVVSESFAHSDQIGHVYGMVNGIEGFLNDTILDFAKELPGEKLEYLKDNSWSLLRVLPVQTSRRFKRSGLSPAVPKISRDEYRLFLLYRRQ